MQVAAKVNQYTKNGTIQFVYTVEGTPEELKAYKASQGEYYRESEDKKPLYFSQRICSVGSELSKTKSGRFTVLQDLESVVAERDAATNVAIGKLEAIRQFTGLSKAQMQEKLLGSF